MFNQLFRQRANAVNWATVLACAVGSSFAVAAEASEHRMCFYVDKGVPGHVFVQFLPKSGPQAGQTNLVYGKYPATNNIFGGAGIIKNDSKREWEQRICYGVTAAQYNAAATKVNGKLAAPPNYNLVRNPPGNCVNWMTDAATAATLTLPGKTNGLGIGTPGTFGDSLKDIGDGNTFMGGTVGFNDDLAVSASGEAVDPDHPDDWDADELADVSVSDPAGTAEALELPLDEEHIGKFAVAPGEPFSVDIKGADPDEALITLDWGDGSPLGRQAFGFTHIYDESGVFELSVVVINSGAVVLRRGLVIVMQDAPPAELLVSIPPPTPAGGSNPGFDDPIPLQFIPIPCEDSVAPECGGTCPPDLACLPDPMTGECFCEAAPIPCEDSVSPECGGFCQEIGQICTPDPNGASCVCLSEALCNEACVWDIDFSGDVRVPDLIKLLSCWGLLSGDPLCACLDIDGSGDIRVPDLIAMLAKWGVCP